MRSSGQRPWQPPAVTVLPIRATANATGMGIDLFLQAINMPFAPPHAQPSDAATPGAAQPVSPEGRTTAAERGRNPWAAPAVTKLPL